tara:strand:+ start:204 stop:521 length:318 start_codon:yes stop_codon:yes gene_type:complete
VTVQLVEIYQDKVAPFRNMKKLPESNAVYPVYALREVYINPEYVVMLRPSVKKSSASLPEGLHSEQEYTTIYMNRGQSGIEITVVGSPELVEEKLRKGKKELLKG